MFSLERLSKIKGANEQKDIMNFFDILDKYISDEEVTLFSSSNNNREKINIDDLRKDNVLVSDNTEIIKNFPQQESNYLKIPKVIE